MKLSTATWCCIAAAIGIVGCGTGGTSESSSPPVVEGDGAKEFVSDVAGQTVDGRSGGPFAAGAGGSASGAPADSSTEAADGAARAISEADIIQLEGSRLYALSRYAGLTIIDVSNPAQLEVLGNQRSAAEPFEMYLRDGVAYVMQNGHWKAVVDEETGQSTWRSTARLLALDVKDPGNIRVIAEHEVAGDISDSRAVGDVLYLVTFENGSCWRCDQLPNTRVTSFDISDPTRFEPIDHLRFDAEENSWAARSIAVTTDRMYVAGPHWSDTTSGGSIQVVDIADPSGELALGAQVEISGIINNRWQMDEHDGVLRVVSQAGGWQSSTPPVVETFRIESSDQLTLIGGLQMVLPRPEQLQSVRFDGERAYAVTFERTDPLFTLDLADPANPKQLGELEIPGWLYHMEPRGDRLYGLGYDDANDGRGLTVSIFDVSDMTAPQMLDRVVFGGEWASQAEDQDRIHKAFNLALDRGMILVPYAGHEYDDATCRGSYESGIQIIDVAGDSLTLRGAAPQTGTARRSLLLDDTLLGISDNAVQAFDISDHGAPKALDEVEVARNIDSLHVMGDTVLRFGHDWWTERTQLDFVNVDAVMSTEPLGELDLSELLSEEEDQCNGYGNWGGGVYVHGDWAYLPRHSYAWSDGSDGNWSQEQKLTIHVLDLRDKSAPRLAGHFEVDAVRTTSTSSGSDYERFGEVLLTDNALLIGRTSGSYRYDPGTTTRQDAEYFYDIFDLSDPAKPTFTRRFQVPAAISSHGWGYAPSGCGMDMGWGWRYGGYESSTALVSGDLVVSNHEEPVDDDSGRVRYFLDRLDVSNPKQPRMLPSVNIPGQVVFFDGSRGLAVTLEDDLRETLSASDWDECTWRGSRAWFDYESKQCRVYDRVLNALTVSGNTATRISRYNLDTERNSQQVAVSGERVFVASSERVRWNYDKPTPVARQIDAFGFAANGQLQVLSALELDAVADNWWRPNLVARGARAFLTEDNDLTVIDTTNKSEPSRTDHEMPGYYCGSLEVRGNRAFCAMGEYGVMAFEL